MIVCGGTLSLGEVTVALSGYGVDEAEARQRAARAAVAVAERTVQARLVSAAVHDLGAGGDVPVPGPAPLGGRWAPGACRVWDVPPGGVSVSWAGGPPVVRADAAAAVETARRLRCDEGLGALSVTFARVAGLAPDQKAAVFDAGVAEVDAAWRACWSGEPTVAASPAPAAPGAGPFVCRSPGGAAGVGRTLDGAVDDALAADSAQRRRAALGAALTGGSRADPAQRASILAAGVSEWIGTPLTDFGLRAGLSCAALPSGAWTFGPATAECPLPGGPASAAACDAQADAGAAKVAAALASAEVSVRSRLALAGWGELSTCHARCAAALRPPTGVAAPLPGVPDRSTEVAARSVLADAVARRDLPLLVAVIPSLPASRLWGMLTERPDEAWPLVDRLVASGELAWRDTGAGWTLAPPR